VAGAGAVDAATGAGSPAGVLIGVLEGATVLVLATGWLELVADVAVTSPRGVGSVEVASPVELPHPARTAAVSVSARSALDEIGFDIARTLTLLRDVHPRRASA
jgi:hypothetical protein